MNKYIWLLLLSDVFVLTGFGLIEPILAVYMSDYLINGTILAAGIASMLFLLTKSLVQLPFSRHIDRVSNYGATRWLVVGTATISIVPILYIFSHDIYLIFLAQIIHGVGSGLAYPAWLGLWSKNLDRNQESYEWSLYSTVVGIGTAITAAVGASVAQFIGFTWTFVMVEIMSLCGCAILLNLQTQAGRMRKQLKKDALSDVGIKGKEEEVF